MIFHTILHVGSHLSNVREGVELQEQISLEEIEVFHTFLLFEL
jgi:hypothetical protein